MKLLWRPVEGYTRFWGLLWGHGIIAVGLWPLVIQLRSGADFEAIHRRLKAVSRRGPRGNEQ